MRNVRISRVVIQDVEDTLKRYRVAGRDVKDYRSLRQFYSNILYEENQYISSVRAQYAYQFVIGITEILNDKFDIDNIKERAEFLLERGIPKHIEEQRKPKNEFATKVKKEVKREDSKPKLSVGLEVGLASPPTGDVK